ncbi:hypothetical protein Bca101_014757 [Brassica carinata]
MSMDPSLLLSVLYSGAETWRSDERWRSCRVSRPPALIHHHRCEPLVTGVIHVVGEPPTSLTLRTAGVMENVRKDVS